MRLHALLPSMLLLVFLAPRVTRAASGDEWLGPDKPKHFAACFVLAGAGYTGGALLFDKPHARWLTGAGLAMGVGVAKEVYDKGRGTTFSMKDLAWDGIGTASGLAVSYLVDRLLFRREDAPEVAQLRPLPRRPAALLFDGAGGRTVRGGRSSRLAFDELYQLLAVQPRVHRHQRAALAGGAADEHGDLAARALVHAAGGQHPDLFPEAAFGERALQPARQIQPASAGAALHEALPADEHLHVLHRSTAAVVPHPSSQVSWVLPSDAPRAMP
ncbi:YfiM family protein [Myxococcus sp. 1LA]